MPIQKAFEPFRQAVQAFSEKEPNGMPTAEVLVQAVDNIAVAISVATEQSDDRAKEANGIAMQSLKASVEANKLSRWAVGISLIAALIASGFWFRLFGC